jgi:hypothetical protein
MQSPRRCKVRHSAQHRSPDNFLKFRSPPRFCDGFEHRIFARGPAARSRRHPHLRHLLAARPIGEAGGGGGGCAAGIAPGTVQSTRCADCLSPRARQPGRVMIRAVTSCQVPIRNRDDAKHRIAKAQVISRFQQRRSASSRTLHNPRYALQCIRLSSSATSSGNEPAPALTPPYGKVLIGSALSRASYDRADADHRSAGSRPGPHAGRGSAG